MIVFDSIDRTSGISSNCELTLTRGPVPSQLLLKNYVVSNHGEIPWIWDGVNQVRVRRSDGVIFDIIIPELASVSFIEVALHIEAASLAAGAVPIGSGVVDGNFFVDYPVAYEALWTQSSARNIFNTQVDQSINTRIIFNSHYVKVPDQLFVNMPYAGLPSIGTTESNSTLTISLVDKSVNQILFPIISETLRFTWYRYSDSTVSLPMTKEWSLIFEPI